MSSSGLRIRLLEPSVGASSGGTHLLIHGKNFRPPPHSLLVRFRLPETNTRVEVPGKFVLETQLECVVPSFKNDVRSVIARHANLAATAVIVALAPQLVALQVEVLLDSELISNALAFLLHQEIVVTKVTPQVVLMTPPTTVVLTLNLLKLSASSRLFPSKDRDGTDPSGGGKPQELGEISSLPVFVRVRQVSERTSALSERTVGARWAISAAGVYEVTFDAAMMTFGDVTVELTLNRRDFFRSKDTTLGAVGYCVRRNVTLKSVDPCCVSVTSGRSTELRLLGEGFVDSGDLTVRLLQRDIKEAAAAVAAASDGDQLFTVAQLTATYFSPTEIRCCVQPNMSFGLTYFQLSLNGGRQYGTDRATALLHRDRGVQSIFPSLASLEGSTSVAIRLGRLTVDDVDAPHQIRNIVPSRRIRVKFEAIPASETATGALSEGWVKVVYADTSSSLHQQTEESPDLCSIVQCRVPSFMEEVTQHKERLKAAKPGELAGLDCASVRRFRVSLSLGGDNYVGSLHFGYFSPPIIQSMTRHHGPSSGGTLILLRMKYRVPVELAIQVRFLALATRESEIVPGIVGTEYVAKHAQDASLSSLPPATCSSPRRDRGIHDDPTLFIVCNSPSWPSTSGPVLTKVQVSLDGGCNFVPAEEEQELAAAGLTFPRSRSIPPPLAKDMSHLYFLFYPLPRLHCVIPMSADTEGGSFIRISGSHVIDHGGQISVVFQSPQFSRKVVGFIENGELRCCVPPFSVGPATIYVSLNGEQYTRCEFVDPDSKSPIEFVYYSSPLLQRLSPLCASISHSSMIRIFGINLIETGRIKVRFGFVNSAGKLVFKDVPGRAQDGVIMAQSPLFGADFKNLKAVVDVALNGNDFSGRTLSLFYYASYAIERVEPAVGAVDISIPLALFVSQNFVTDALFARVRFKRRLSQEEITFGPVAVTRWDSSRVDFVLPAICEFVRSVHDVESAFVDLSFDKSYFIQVGDLLRFYRPYKLPPMLSISPLVGHFEHETIVVAKSSGLQDGDVLALTLTLVLVEQGQITPRGRTVSSEVVVVLAETNAKRQTLTWRCPPLHSFANLDLKSLVSDEKRMLLPAVLAMQISTVAGQLLALPFRFQFYRMPVLVSMSPRVGYICGSSLISFEFKEPIETPTIDFRFGPSIVTSGRVREENKCFVECLSPVLEAGVHVLALSFDEQYFEQVDQMPASVDEDEDNNNDGGGVTEDCFRPLGVATPEEARAPKTSQIGPFKCTFQAFAMPRFTIPGNRNRVYGFGPLDGDSLVLIRGNGFIADGKIYVRFSSSSPDAFVGPNGSQSETTVHARVVDDRTIVCMSPPAIRPGRALLQVTYNLQEFTDSSCFFEYHNQTKFASRGILCGPVSGGTPVSIQVENAAGLPEDKSLLFTSCAIRFFDGKDGCSRDVDATFDEESLTLHCVAPPWPSNALVSIQVTLSKYEGAPVSLAQYRETSLRFMFYDPPEGLITIEPSAGPVAGGTVVLAYCGRMVDTGEIMVSVTLVDTDPEGKQIKELASVGEDEEGASDEEEPCKDGATASRTASTTEEYRVKGRIIGEAVQFTAPAVSKPGVAVLNIALNGINYISMQTSTLRFKYYPEPVIQRISPAWCATDAECVMTISGGQIHDHGCKPVVRFQLQQHQSTKDTHPPESILIEASFVELPPESKASSVTKRALQCSFQAPFAGFFEIQISLNNGQQFSSSRFMSAAFGNYSGSACTALLPFRSFATPFLLATPTGSVAGGSTVTLYMSEKLSKLLSRESKCQVQFAPIKSGDASAANVPGPTSPQRSSSLAGPEGVVVVGEIDHAESKITCRAPLLRSACVAVLDLLLPASVTSGSDLAAPTWAKGSATASSPVNWTSSAAFFGAKEREKFHAYESPTISELAPSCGPLSGGTCIVIECSNIVDTGQIFVRFRSSANERECILVPTTFSRVFPDGSLSASPLLICQTPKVEVVNRFVVSVTDTVPSAMVGQPSPQRGSAARDGSAGAMTAKTRAHSFQQMAELSLRKGAQSVLRVTRSVLKNAPTSSITTSISVLVDFTMNAGEQFIAHSVPFQFYPSLYPRELKWSPRHMPSLCYDRSTPTETRVLTIQLPKSLRSFTDSTSAAERVSFYFDGAPQQLFSSTQKRRGSSIVLHETGNARELLVLDAPPAAKLRKESTMRRRSTHFRNSSISATSNNLLDSSKASLAANVARPRAAIGIGGAGPRRPSVAAFGGGGFPTTIGGSTALISAQPASPYIAAKITKGGLEVTCPVPEFSGSGSVQVFFSFNAQQFVCLGELFIHDPLAIREDQQHRFTSSIGCDQFVLHCSPSSVFSFLSSSDVLNEAELVTQQQRKLGTVTTSRVLRNEDLVVDSAVNDSDSSAAVAPHDGDAVSGWHDRLFHILQLHLVPPNPRLLRKIHVSASSVRSKAELAACLPNDFGCCVFEATEWKSDMLLTAVVPPGVAISSYSSCLTPKSRDCGSTNHALLLQLPTSPNEIVACCYGNPNPANTLVVVDSDGVPVCSGADVEELSVVTFEAVSSSATVGDGDTKQWFVCLDLRGGNPHDSKELQVVVADSMGGQVYLSGSSPGASGIWIIAMVSQSASSSCTVGEVDCRVESYQDIAVLPALKELHNTSSVFSSATSTPSSHSQAALSATACVQFACAESSRNLSMAATAQIVLPGDHTLPTFLSGESLPKELLLRCKMPALPFNGPTILSVQVDGVTFSNSLCVYCYDPRLWRITRIDPPCGLVQRPLRLRIFGEHFVDTKKTVIRLSDATRFQTYQAAMERYRLLIVRVATVRNLRQLLPPQFVSAISAGSPQKAQQVQTQPNREDANLNLPSFTVAARVAYRDQRFQATSRESAVHAALVESSSAAPLGWEDQFEVQIPAEALTSALLVVTLELVELGRDRSQWELGRVVVPTFGLKEAALVKRAYQIEEHFRWRNRAAAPVPIAASAPATVDVFLHLSPLMTHSDIFTCNVPPFPAPHQLRVQISSGDSFFSPCPPIKSDEVSVFSATEPSKAYRPLFQTYALPVVLDTKPRVLPRTAGGELFITGDDFIACGDRNQATVRLFGCTEGSSSDVSDQELLRQINATSSLQTPPASQFFIRDVQATLVSRTTLKLTVPPRLAAYRLYYRVSVDDGMEFSVATTRSYIMLYSADAVEPKGGPVSGNTYVSVQCTNLNACMALGGLVPVVRLTWMRGTRELESIVVRGEFYPGENVVYFYTPQSKFGLQNVTVLVEVSLVSDTEIPATAPTSPGALNAVLTGAVATFGRDEIPFVVYRTPTIKAISPLQSLVYGLSSLDLIVQGLDDKASTLLKNSVKARFKRRGQMQLADVHISSGVGTNADGKLSTVVPRFVVGSAVATDVVGPAAASPSPSPSPSPTRQTQTALRNALGAPKVWTRHGAVFVVLLRARNLLVAKKSSTCNPFVVVQCNKMQLRSTRKDGTSAPEWNELLDFDWRSEKELPQLIRLSVENQLTSNQSELLGQVSIGFADARDVSRPFSTRGWFPLHRATVRGASDSSGKPHELGDVEVAIAFVPVPAKKMAPKIFQAAALKSSIMSAIQQQKQNAAAAAPQQPQETPRSRKERLLRAFRHRSAPSSIVPSELIVELAINGQDFWSSAPSRCLLVPPPIVLTAEPSFVCISGGTPLTITGMNFVPCGVLRVAFAVGEPSHTVPVDSQRITIVDAKYRSSHCITCVTPPLHALGATSGSSVVSVFVSLNGLDFDSISLPVKSDVPMGGGDRSGDAMDPAATLHPPPSPSGSLRAVGERCVIDNKALADQVAARSSQMLLHQVRVYTRPSIHRVRPADGVYTSSLLVEGHNFCNTGMAIARYCSTKDTLDVRTSPVVVVSPDRMKCNMPDFPRGTVVTISFAMNGVEFVACPGELEVFQSPRLTTIVPGWVAVSAKSQQDVRILGVNLTTKESVSGSVQVSFQRGKSTKVVKGQCVDGEVLCCIPHELMASAVSADGCDDELCSSSIFVDVWLGGTHRTFTGRPLELRLYRSIPTVSVVAPTNGPIYGGYPVVIDGSGFINTGHLVARFHALHEDTNRELGTSPSKRCQPLLPARATFVDATARFVSTTSIVCTAPGFPHEGVYSVSVSLNGVEFNCAGADELSATWFLAWQNWQRRKRLTAQRRTLETAFVTSVEAAATPLGDAVPVDPLTASLTAIFGTETPSVVRPPSSPRPSTVETAFGRRVSSRTSPRSLQCGDQAATEGLTELAATDSPRRRHHRQRLVLNKIVEDESLERVEDRLVDIRLLQWHPASVEDKSLSLTALLTELLNAPKTQQIMIRQIGFVFRARGSRDPATGHYKIGSLMSFMHALKIVFPHAPQTQYEELWKALDPTQLGFVTLHSITEQLIRTESLRPVSPEPGPTHYNPSYALAEPKPPIPVILPQVPASTEEAGLPSELFMNYDAFKAVRPRVKGGAFPRREPVASWCNPVPKDLLFKTETYEEMERTFAEQQQPQKSRSFGQLGSLASSPKRSRPRPTEAPPSRSTWRPTLFEHKLQHETDVDGDDSDIGDGDCEAKRDGGGGVSRGERLTRAVAANAPNTATKPASPAASVDVGRISPSRGRSILHNDIAPLYLKFLRSKEVQRGNSAMDE